MFGIGAKLLVGLAGVIALRQLPVDGASPVRPKQREKLDEIHLYVYPEGKSFRQSVVKSVVDDVNRNGPTRDIISRVAGG